MVTNLSPNAGAPAANGDSESAPRLWRAFSALVNARRAVRREPCEATILALCAAEAGWRRAQDELRSAVLPDLPPAGRA